MVSDLREEAGYLERQLDLRGLRPRPCQDDEAEAQHLLRIPTAGRRGYLD
jgi:hypothetical protein